MNTELQMTLDEAVGEVLGLLTGLELSYDPELERYRAITRALNRGLRSTALENEWSYYHDLFTAGTATKGSRLITLPGSKRARIVGDDTVRLVDPETGLTVRWAYYLPRDALHKYEDRSGLWCSVVRQMVHFSRPFTDAEDGMQVKVPVMREPNILRLPEPGKNVSKSIRSQLIDFPYPDAIVTRAAYFYSQTDPVMQPRVPTLEENYKDVMYQLIERDTNHTDTPYENNFILPLENGLVSSNYESHRHPHAE